MSIKQHSNELIESVELQVEQNASSSTHRRPVYMIR